MKILPLYFPRSSQEEVDAIKLLPEDIGNENGEPIIPERQIRIMDKPMLASMSKLQTISSKMYSLKNKMHQAL